ncbi:MAG: NUDIX domain-containing protein, partial [Actinomycetes bacterium]|nr:NUDIX domain-containing protein [Actinomycetes bacterium]
MSARFTLVPAAYVYLRRESEVLLQLRQNTGFMDGHWAAAIAGHVEAGESVTDAAIREAAEEVGVEVPGSALTPLTVLHRTDGSGDPVEQRADFFFESRFWLGEPRILEAAKCADLRWFRIDDLPEPMPPHERFVLERLADEELPAFLPFGFRQ